MKTTFLICSLIFSLMIILLAGCSKPQVNEGAAKKEVAHNKEVTVRGQIQVEDAGKIQATGLAPIWIYDVSNEDMATNLPLPKFGGRTRDDWKRIVAAYPKSLDVYSNYAVLAPLGPATEVKRIAAREEYLAAQNATNGLFGADAAENVKQLEAKWEKLYKQENECWDAADDMRELIVFWYNVNPGILYQEGLPEAVAKAQTGKDGSFSVDVPKPGKYLVAAHIEGSIKGNPGNYFWLLPFQADSATNEVIVLNEENAVHKRVKAKMPQIILPETNGFLGNVGFWMLNRVRDARSNL